MRRARFTLGVLGLILAAATAHAAVPQQVKVLGTEYTVTVNPLSGTYKNGVKIQLPTGGVTTQKANFAFAQGADESTDQLYVVAPIGTNDDEEAQGDQFFRLEGSDANGIFSPATSNATQLFGKFGGLDAGGRPQTVHFLNDLNTGPKMDLNLAMFFFRGDDAVRFFDLDTLQGNFAEIAVETLTQPVDAEAAGLESDPNMPRGDHTVVAPGPNGTVIVMGKKDPIEADLEDVQIGVLDLSKRPLKFAPVMTDLVEAATKDSAIKIDPRNVEPHAFVRVAENEYLLLLSQSQQGNNDSTEWEHLYRLRITAPSDLSKEAPNSIKVEVLGQEDLLALKLHPEDSLGGLFGMTAGRKGRLYFGDWRGNIITLNPVAPPTAGN
jgi:hypothetical protein